jgi:hypothetical protein
VSASPGQRGLAHPGRLAGHPLQLVGRRVDDAAAGRVRHPLQHDQVAQPLQQVTGEPARVVAGLDQPVDGGERGRAVAGRERVGHLVDQGHVGHPEQLDRPGVGHAVDAGARDELVQHRERVPHRTAAGPHDQRHCDADRYQYGDRF